MINLIYDPNKWSETYVRPMKTLQVFITGRCNAACKTCFFRKHLKDGDMSFDNYAHIVHQYEKEIEKVILIGGEPSLHSKLKEMVHLNYLYGLQTTIYTNGANLEALERCAKFGPSIRLSVSVTPSMPGAS